MCYSGGKDSTYTLAVLREKYKLNVLAVSFDNGFIPDQTMLNIRNVVENLCVDHIMIKPRFDVLARIFRYCAKSNVYSSKAMERSSAICTSCMGIIKYSVLRLAIEKNIPFIAYGWSPGQAPIHSSVLKNTPQMVRMMQEKLFNPLHQIVGDLIRPYFLEDKHFNGLGEFPYNINPLAFLDYNLEAIYKDSKRFGWIKPKDTDASSSNCLLNSFANVVHRQKFNFHPYAFEMANLVREGYIDRTTALIKLYQPENSQTIKIVTKKLRLKQISIDNE
jgi:tRNA(Ile)-lysidine synthase TilS/MesJ